MKWLYSWGSWALGSNLSHSKFNKWWRQRQKWTPGPPPPQTPIHCSSSLVVVNYFQPDTKNPRGCKTVQFSSTRGKTKSIKAELKVLGKEKNWSACLKNWKFEKLQIYTVLAQRNIAEQFTAGVNSQQKLLGENPAQVKVPLVPFLWGLPSGPVVFSWFTRSLVVLHLKLNTRNVFSFINQEEIHFSGIFSQPFVPSLDSERGVWLKLSDVTLRKKIRIQKPHCAHLKRKYLIECVFLVPPEIKFQSIQCAQLLVLLWDMYKSKSIQGWNKQTKKCWLPTFSPSDVFFNKNTGFLPNTQNQHLYSVVFFSKNVSEIVSLFLAQVNL